MGLRNLLSSSSCGNHHWGEWTETGDYTFKESGTKRSKVNVLKKKVRSCKHDCDASEEKWYTVGRVDQSAVVALAEKEYERLSRELSDILNGCEIIVGHREQIEHETTIIVQCDNCEETLYVGENHVHCTGDGLVCPVCDDQGGIDIECRVGSYIR